jgi:glycosyltransferase involved in cell wall biosynthesis
MTDRPLRVAVLVNTLAPSRIPIYAALASQFELLVLHGGKESNRDAWADVDNGLQNATVKKAWGWQIPLRRKQNGQVFDRHYLHITPGYLWHLLRFQPDAVVTNEMGLRTIIALAYGTIFRKPVWVWWGGTQHTESKIGLVKRVLRRFVSAWTRRWISYGASSTTYLLSLGIQRNRILQIQNAVDERNFAESLRYESDVRRRPTLLYVGQLIARKGVDLLLTAASAVQQSGRDFSLILVGSGPDKQFLEQRIRDLELKNVVIRPPVQQTEIRSVYRTADVLVFPTLEDPWGLVVNEAMLSGLDVLCSKYAGCAEELLAPECIFDPKDPREFREKLGQAVDGRLPTPDRSRLRSISEISDDLIRDVKRATAKAPRHQPPASVGLSIER